MGLGIGKKISEELIDYEDFFFRWEGEPNFILIDNILSLI